MAGDVRFRSADELLASVRRCATELGETPSAADYHNWQHAKPHEPNLRLIRKWLGSWEQVVGHLSRVQK